KALGIFGSPSFLVDGEPFWGDDRLDDAIRWLKQMESGPPDWSGRVVLGSQRLAVACACLVSMKASRIAFSMPSIASPAASGLRCSTTLEESMSPKPSAAVNSRQSAGMLLREIGAIARPEVTASVRPPLVSLV